MILEIRNLSKNFSDLEVLKNIKLNIKKGEFFSILGPSGSGKTTLLRIIAGFEDFTNGDLIIDGKKVNNIPPEKRDVSIVFQNLALFPMMNVFDNVAFGLRMKKVPKKIIKEEVFAILKKVGLEGFERRKIDELSGGQKQRVAIARSLIMKPKILLLDEPLSALDRQLREHMKVELKLLQKEFGITFVYITHDQSEAMEMSNRVCVINNGVIEQIDTPYNLYNNPKTPFIASFIGENNKIEVDTDNSSLISKKGWKLPLKCNAKIIFIRPEDIKINEKKDINLTAKVTAFFYDGFNTKVNVITQYGEEMIIRVLDKKINFKEGDQIQLGINKDDIKFF